MPTETPSEQMKCSPLPWKVEKGGYIRSEFGSIAGVVFEDDARLIVHCVNHFEDLKKALEELSVAGSMAYEFSETSKRAIYELKLLDSIKSARSLLASLERSKGGW